MLNANFVMQGILETAVNVLFSKFPASSNFMLHQILCYLKFNASSNPWCRQVSSIGDWWLDKKTRQKVSRQNFFCGFVNKREQASDRSALTPRLVLAIASQTALGCVFFGKSENASLMKDHLNHVASKNQESFPRVDSLVPLRVLSLLYDIIGGLK